MRQLVISGDSWEVRQQRRLLDEGHKEYRLLFAYDSSQTFEFMDAVTSILFDDSAWELLLSRTERRQLQGCFEGLRLGAMGHQLVPWAIAGRLTQLWLACAFVSCARSWRLVPSAL